MNITIVYKTYGNDLKWLKYSLISCNKYLKECDIYEIIIYFHDKCKVELLEILEEVKLEFKFRIIPVTYYIHGYLSQQITKLTCYNDVQTDYILFIDSDTIFIKTVSPQLLFDADGKIKWYILRKKDCNSKLPDWSVWNNAVVTTTKGPMNIYFMANGFPFIVNKNHLKMLNTKFIEMHGANYLEYCVKECVRLKINMFVPTTQCFGNLSQVIEEFELMGWYCYNFHKDEYIFIDDPVRKENEKNYTKQYWSYGGLTDKIQQEIMEILGK